MSGDLARARRLAGNPSTTNVADGDITQGLNYGTSQVMEFTGKTDWETSTSHLSYAKAVTAAEYFASSYVRDRFNDQTKISDEHFDRGIEICNQIADAMADASLTTGAVGIGAVKGKYRSFPLNSSAMPYRSMSSQGQELVGVGDYDIP